LEERGVKVVRRPVAADVLYVNGPRWMPVVALLGVKAPIVFHAHNRLSQAKRRLVEWALRRTRATVIAASRFVWDGEARVVYSGVAGGARKRTGGAIGMIGRFSPQKGQREFVRAAALLGVGWRFVLCGRALFGNHRYQQAVLAEAPASVEFLGWREDVYEVLAGLDLLVTPSAGEGGVPRVILEAFAAGVPVLALDSGAIPEVVREGHNGFLLRSASPEEIAGRVRELMGRPELRAEVAAQAQREWEERFTAERYRREVWEVITARGTQEQRK
jgi:glycosyltransferase involved in cell wall biosynthesis